jgi:hypothetical protein
MKSQVFGPWVQNSGFGFGEPCQEKIPLLGASHPQLVDLERKDGVGFASAGITFISRTFSQPSTSASIDCFFTTAQ